MRLAADPPTAFHPSPRPHRAWIRAEKLKGSPAFAANAALGAAVVGLVGVEVGVGGHQLGKDVGVGADQVGVEGEAGEAPVRHQSGEGSQPGNRRRRARAGRAGGRTRR